jgi:membrane glycosyltransferase
MERIAEEGLTGRRLIVFGLTGGSLIGLGLAMAEIQGSGGWSPARLAILLLFLAGLPWTLLAFWNSVIGFIILRLVADPAAYTNPALRRMAKDAPLTSRVAVCLAIRHEVVDRAFTRLAAMIESLEATGWSRCFGFHVLSDSSRLEVVAAEERAFAALKARHPRPGFLHYRRRPANIGYKAGNLREFAEGAAGSYDHMIVLDADSLMSGASLLRLVRVMEANPRLGILQTLVTGRPSESAFARIFQFGMRHSMRTHTIGIAWWQGPSGPYWGHNAIIRLVPFIAHCRLPLLPGRPPLGGHVLSHDQVEAALMRASGYEVRVIADELESWEENPPSLPDFIKRDLRWCQGNMQYLRVIGRPGLGAMGRFQLLNAMFMYLGAPLWVLMLAAGLVGALLPSPSHGLPFPSGLAFALYIATLLLGFMPRLLGMADIMLQPARRAAYGGGGCLLAGAVVDMVFSLFMGPIMMVAVSVFLAGLPFGRCIAWQPQKRDGHRVFLAEALQGLWPQLLFGALLAVGIAMLAPWSLAWALPTVLALAVAIPFAMATASPWAGRWMMRWRLCALPDEYAPAAELQRLQRRPLPKRRKAA